MSRRWLVTGATGFVGACFVRSLLADGEQVFALLRPSSDAWRLRDLGDRLSLVPGDLTDLHSVLAACTQVRPDVIAHFAATHGHAHDQDTRLLHLHGSVTATAHLLEGVRALPGCRFLHVGSSTEYGAHDVPLVETMRLQPSSFRGAVKAAAAMLALEASRSVPVSVVRPFSVYGPWESPERFIPTIIRRALRNEPLALTTAGVRHDFVYVDDVVAACRRAVVIEPQPYALFNVGSGVQTSNEAVALLVKELCHSDSAIELGTHPHHVPDTSHWVADLTHSERALGWRPTVSLRDGLARVIEWTRLRETVRV